MTFTTHDTADPNDLDFVPEARIGAPLIRSRWRRAAKGLALAATLGLGTWTALDETAPLRTAWALSLDALRPLMQEPARPPAPQAAADPLPAPPALEPVATAPVTPLAAQPEAAASVARSEPAAPAEALPQSPSAAVEKPEPLPKPVAADPLERRALAVGLHPGLSRVLLSKLSDTDYRNAGIAIRTALAETKLGGDLIWPKNPPRADAQFKVSLVQGASDCRRYVVLIAKDGWTTSALPMEKCGTRAK